MQDRVAMKSINSEARMPRIESCLGLNPPLSCGMSFSKFLKSHVCLLRLAVSHGFWGVASLSIMPPAESQRHYRDHFIGCLFLKIIVCCCLLSMSSVWIQSFHIQVFCPVLEVLTSEVQVQDQLLCHGWKWKSLIIIIFPIIKFSRICRWKFHQMLTLSL